MVFKYNVCTVTVHDFRQSGVWQIFWYKCVNYWGGTRKYMFYYPLLKNFPHSYREIQFFFINLCINVNRSKSRTIKIRLWKQFNCLLFLCTTRTHKQPLLYSNVIWYYFFIHQVKRHIFHSQSLLHDSLLWWSNDTSIFILFLYLCSDISGPLDGSSRGLSKHISYVDACGDWILAEWPVT